jgi:putative spermidine/putrescine transport system permease protein
VVVDPGPAVRLDRPRFPWRGYGLVSPAVLLTSFVFGSSMVILLGYSFRAFRNGTLSSGHTTATWSGFLASSYYWHVVWTTMKLGLVTTAVTAAIGYPLALALHRLRTRWLRLAASFLIFMPLLTSVVVRSYGWALILGDGGLVNHLLLQLHLIHSPIRMLYEFDGVTVALVHILLPFMIFPIASVLDQLDPTLEQAAADLGAHPFTVFRRVTLPLSVQGVIAGSQLVFALAISAFGTPSLLGGGRVQVLATEIYTDVGSLDWPHAAVASYVLLAFALAAIAAFSFLLRLQTGTRAVAR